MRKTKKTLAILAIVAMVVTMLPVQVFAADSSVTPDRIYGDTAYDTAAQIAAFGWANGGSDTAVLSAGYNKKVLVDALSAGPLAATLDAPILLTEGAQLPAKTKSELVDLGVKTVYVTSGTAVIKPSVITELENMGITVKNVYGVDASATSVAIAKAMVDNGASFDNGVVVAGGNGADALSVSSIAAAQGMPIFYSTKAGLPDSVKTYLNSLSIAKSYVIGGTGVLSAAVEAALPGTVARYYGVDAYDTNNQVIQNFDSSLKYDNVFVANGKTLVDALAGAPLAAKYQAPILLTDGSAVKAADFVNGKLGASSVVTAFGGGAVVPSAVTGKVAYVPPVVSTLSVESVSALNAQQIQVVFNKEVDDTSAEAGTNYKITDKDGATVNLVTDNSTTKSYDAVLQSDDRTVVLTLAAPITKKTDLTVVVTKSICAKDDSSEYAPLYSKVITVNDETAPEVTQISSKTKDDSTKEVNVTFSEPVAAAAFKIDGKSTASASWTANNTKVKLTAASDLDVADSHNLQVVNATDGADNVASLISKTFTITQDTAAPVIVSLSQYSDKKVLVEFNKKMDDSTLTTSNVAAVDSTLTSHSIADVSREADDSGHLQYVVTLNSVSYSSDDNSETFTLSFSKNITDDLGNELTAVTKQITLTEDKVKPSVVSTKVVKDVTGKVTKVEVKFDEALSATDISKLVVVNKNGVDVTTDLLPNDVANAPAFTSAPFDGKTVDLTLNAPYKLNDKFTFTFKKGFASDAAIAQNGSNAYAITIDFGAASADKFELSGTPVTSAGTNAYYVDFSRQVKGGDVSGSATNVARYTLNGSVLPAGTTITLNAPREIATITLPSGSVTDSDSTAIFTIIGVQDLDDNTIVPYTTTVASVDNIKPVLQSASLFSYDNSGASPYEASIILTFDEDMSITGGTDVSDELAIKVGGNDKSIATAVAYPVSGKAKQVKVDFTFATQLDTNKTITIKTVDGDGGIHDASTLNNAAKSDVSVTVIK